MRTGLAIGALLVISAAFGRAQEPATFTRTSAAVDGPRRAWPRWSKHGSRPGDLTRRKRRPSSCRRSATATRSHARRRCGSTATAKAGRAARSSRRTARSSRSASTTRSRTSPTCSTRSWPSRARLGRAGAFRRGHDAGRGAAGADAHLREAGAAARSARRAASRRWRTSPAAACRRTCRACCRTASPRMSISAPGRRRPCSAGCSRRGSLDDAEMLRTFNCGIGMVLVVGEGRGRAVLAALRRRASSPSASARSSPAAASNRRPRAKARPRRCAIRAAAGGFARMTQRSASAS